MLRTTLIVCFCVACLLVAAGCSDGSGVANAADRSQSTSNGDTESGRDDSGDSEDDALDISNDPPLQTSQAELDASLHCTAFEHADKPPVLLVHGTTVTGTEQYTAFYTPQLVELGFDVCIVTYPDRGLGDMQVSAEYVVNALRSIYTETGRKVAMIGHSQGGLMPRWAIKFFPSARQALADFVMIAGPNHGTTIALPGILAESLSGLLGLDRLSQGLAPEAVYQFEPGSDFVTALNAEDETPGEIDYTALYTLYDEIVRPVVPEPTAALDFEQGNPQVSNILLQDVCPAHLSEHFAIGTADSLAFVLAVDAISNPGPADVERAGGASGLCGLLPVDLADLAMPENVARLLEIVDSSVREPELDPNLAAEEPELMDYAQHQREPGA